MMSLPNCGRGWTIRRAWADWYPTGWGYYAYYSASLSEYRISSTSISSSYLASYACKSPSVAEAILDAGLTRRNRLSGLTLIFIEVPLLLRICPTSPTFDNFIRRFTTNYMRAAIYGVMSLIQWLSCIVHPTSLIAAAIVLLLAATCYLIAGLKGQGFVGSKTLGGQGVAQMIV